MASWREPYWVAQAPIKTAEDNGDDDDGGIESVVALLCPGARLSFVGSCRVVVLRGVVDINGYQLAAQGQTDAAAVAAASASYEADGFPLSSPRCGPLCCITPIATPAATTGKLGNQRQVKLGAGIESECRRLAAESTTTSPGAQKKKKKKKTKKTGNGTDADGSAGFEPGDVTVLELREWESPVADFISTSCRQFRNVYGATAGANDDGDGDYTPATTQAGLADRPLSTVQVQREPVPDLDQQLPAAVLGEPFVAPDGWLPALDRLKELMAKVEVAHKTGASVDGAPVAPVMVIVGGKDTGKSSTAQWMVNRLLQTHSEVGYLDADVGQSEFTPAGLVSLSFVKDPVVGPAFTHQRTPFASSFVGGDSPAENPTDFLRAVFGLFDRYLLRCATTTSCPLIINTQGWVKGLGYVMLLDVLRYCAPSVVVQIEAGVFKKDLPELVPLPEGSVFVADFPAVLKTNPAVFSWLPYPEIFKIASVTSMPPLAAATAVVVPGGPAVATPQPPQQQPQKKNMSLGAKELRTLSLMAYFGQPQTVDGLAVPLSMQQPYSVSWDLVDVKFPRAPVAAGNVLQALNASVVALLRDARSAPTRTGMAGGVGAASTCSAMECLGYGLIRSIDAESRVFYINTPVAVTSLKTVTVLAKAHMDVPQVLMIQGTFGAGVYMTYDFSSASVAGGKGRKTRTNLVRKRKSADA